MTVCDRRNKYFEASEEKAIVFVVDDEALNRAIHCGFVRSLGYQPIEQKSGKEAVMAFREACRSGTQIAAIIMDINMPGMDGLEAAWRIRAMEAAAHPCICQDAVVPVLNQPYILCNRLSESLVHRANPDDICIPDRALGDGMAEGSLLPGACDCCATRVPIWAVSASSLQEQANSPAMKFLPPTNKGPPWRRAGFDAFIAKPAHKCEFLRLLNSTKPHEQKLNTARCTVPETSRDNASSVGSQNSVVTSFLTLSQNSGLQGVCQNGHEETSDPICSEPPRA